MSKIKYMTLLVDWKLNIASERVNIIVVTPKRVLRSPYLSEIEPTTKVPKTLIVIITATEALAYSIGTSLIVKKVEVNAMSDVRQISARTRIIRSEPNFVKIVETDIVLLSSCTS